MTNETLDLEGVLSQAKLGAALSWKNLQIFPLGRADGEEPLYGLLDDLLDQGTVEITELNDGGAVPTIKVLNKADIDALILDGSELRGAKQNRMVNLTIVVGKGSETEIPVACVERGRWAYRSRGFASAKRTVASRLRRSKAAMVSESLARLNAARVDQERVWDGVQSYLDAAKVSSETSALDDAFMQREAETEECITALGKVDACGVIVVLDGEIVGLDLFDAKSTFEKAWPALLRGYALDAVLNVGRDAGRTGRRGKRPASGEAVRQWLDEVRKLTATRRQVPGVGEYYVVHDSRATGGIVLYKGRVVHAALFPVSDQGSAAWDEA